MANSRHQERVFFDCSGEVSQKFKNLLFLLMVPGVGLFLYGALQNGELRIWQIYLVNLLFWSGLSQAGVTVSALIRTTNGKWGRNIQHIMEGMSLFSPIALVLFLILFMGGDVIFSWAGEPVVGKTAWLNLTHLFVRHNVNFLAINIFNFIFLYHSFRPDVGLMMEKKNIRGGWIMKKMTEGWRGYEEERRRSEEKLRWISPLILFVYAVVYSLIGYDFVMSLDPYWYSTLFGAYYFMTNLYLGIAGITIGVILVCHKYKLRAFVTESHLSDLGVMLFVFCLIALDFFWSQYLVIWYGNLPEEISFVVERTKEAQWLPFSLTILASCFGLPFLILLSGAVKKNPRSLLAVACLVLAGMWIERYILVVPTLWHGGNAPLGLPELLVTLAFLSAFVLVFVAVMERFPILPRNAEDVGGS